MGSVGRLEENMRVCHIISGITLGLVALLQGAPQTNFGNNNSKNQEEQQGSGPDETVDKKILFGNSNLNNILLGAAVGAGGAFLAQEFVNGQNNQDCSCGPSRRKRQINLSGKRARVGAQVGIRKYLDCLVEAATVTVALAHRQPVWSSDQTARAGLRGTITTAVAAAIMLQEDFLLSVERNVK